eukprot:gnl/MRDRNA2_/MRDRNA2_160733_c0_seq1.p1 gnl/MRDRNA2_/MRDRNA2_160733_c0~~gnl/MRDRNA2_/MRDRNA2_160733_c0_seq1.p1  ORF type:complete len:244 (+),score=47.08 gnl/MRDRNA2_/MRDRNA2_160733_c0_seq1:213-944(+)
MHFTDTYAEIAMDPEARAKAPILEVGKAGEPGHVRLIESDVVSRYLEAAFPKPSMQPSDPARQALGNMFVTTFMEVVSTNYHNILAAKTQEQVDSCWMGIRRGLFAVEIGLQKYRSGKTFFDESFGLVEAMVAPFVVRMLLNVKHHRGVDILSLHDIPGATAWMVAIRDHPSVVETCPAEKSLCAIPPYVQPFFKSTVSAHVVQAKPTSAAQAEAEFAASIDAGLVHAGKAARDRSDQTRSRL